MRKLILILFLALFMNSAYAAWTLVAISNDDNDNYFIDKSTIRKNGTKVKAWFLNDMKIPSKNNEEKYYSSVKRLSEFDCKNETNIGLASVGTADNMGGGAVVFSYTYDDRKEFPAQPIVPGSIGEAMFKAVCGKK
jgi:hypothetical protein